MRILIAILVIIIIDYLKIPIDIFDKLALLIVSFLCMIQDVAEIKKN